MLTSCDIFLCRIIHSPVSLYQHQVRSEHTDSGGPTLRWLAREVKFAPPDPKAPPSTRPDSSVSGVERMARVRQVSSERC